MHNNPLVSIIVPVYNASNYLWRCLRSIQLQSWKNIEVRIVNDGSQDNSLEICQEFAGKDSRFHIINQENKGVSEARNAALKQAQGIYLQFVDADDYLPLNATESLVRTAWTTGADLVIAHFYRVVGIRQSQRGHIKEQRVFNQRDFAEIMMKAPANFYYGVLWNKLYRRRIVEANNLRFDTQLCWCEDFLFNLEYIKYVKLIAATPNPVYYYVKRHSSLTNTQSNLRNTICIKRMTFACYKQMYIDLELFDEQKIRVYGYLLSAARDGSSICVPVLPAFLREHKYRRI